MPTPNQELIAAALTGDIAKAERQIQLGASLRYQQEFPEKAIDETRTWSTSNLLVDALYCAIHSSKTTLQQKIHFLRFLMNQTGFNPNSEYQLGSFKHKTINSLHYTPITHFALFLLLLARGDLMVYPSSSSDKTEAEYRYYLKKMYDSFSQEEWDTAYKFYCDHEASSREFDTESHPKPKVNLTCLFFIVCCLGDVKPLYYLLGERFSEPTDELFLSFQRDNHIAYIPTPLEFTAYCGSLNAFIYLRCRFYELDKNKIEFSWVKRLIDDNANTEISPLLLSMIKNKVEKNTRYCLIDHEKFCDLTLFLFISIDSELKDEILIHLESRVSDLLTASPKNIVPWLELVFLKKGTPIYEKLLPVVRKLLALPVDLTSAFPHTANINFVNFLFDHGANQESLALQSLQALLRTMDTKFYKSRLVLETELRREFGNTIVDILLKTQFLINNARGQVGYCAYGPASGDEQFLEAAVSSDLQQARLAMKTGLNWKDHVASRYENGAWSPELNTSAFCLRSDCTPKQKLAFLKFWIENREPPKIDLNHRIRGAQTAITYLATNEDSYALVLLCQIYGTAIQSRAYPARIKSALNLHGQFSNKIWEEVIDKRTFHHWSSFNIAKEKIIALFWLCCLLGDWNTLHTTNQRSFTRYNNNFFELVQTTYESIDALDIAAEHEYNEFFMMTCLHCIKIDIEKVVKLVDKYMPQKKLADDSEFKTELEVRVELALTENDFPLLSFFLFCYDDVELQIKIAEHLTMHWERISSRHAGSLLSWLELVAHCKSPEVLSELSPVIDSILTTYPDVFTQACFTKSASLVKFLCERKFLASSLSDEQLAKIFTDKNQTAVAIELLRHKAKARWQDSEHQSSLLCIEKANDLSDQQKADLMSALIIANASLVDPKDPDLLAKVNNRVRIAELLITKSANLEAKLDTTLEALQHETQQGIVLRGIVANQESMIKQVLVENGKLYQNTAQFEQTLLSLCAEFQRQWMEFEKLKTQTAALTQGMLEIVPRTDALASDMREIKPRTQALIQAITTKPAQLCIVPAELDVRSDDMASNFEEEIKLKVSTLEEKTVSQQQELDKLKQENEKKDQVISLLLRRMERLEQQQAEQSKPQQDIRDGGRSSPTLFI